MSHHEFGIMQISPQNGQCFDEDEPENYNCISVNDGYIENILEKLTDIDFYWHTTDVSGKGLAYCGVTLVPPSSMQRFISVIDDNPDLNQLKDLLTQALNENKWIIHFGL